MTAKPAPVSGDFIRTVCERLRRNERIRRTLPLWGRLHIERQLPFLCIYRRPREGNDAGTARLVVGEASYLKSSGAAALHRSLRTLAVNLSETIADIFGAGLVIEVWSAPPPELSVAMNDHLQLPGFRIIAPRSDELATTVEKFREALANVRVAGHKAAVELAERGIDGPPVLPRLFKSRSHGNSRVHRIGLEVKPIYRNPATGEVYPLVLRELHRALTRALKQAVFEFARSCTTHTPPHYQALGRRAVVKSVWEVDAQLAEVSNALDVILYVTPINADAAFSAFRRSRFESVPRFLYRPRSVDPSLLKRKLFAVPLERIEDPLLHQIFRETQDELDQRITLVADRGTTRFLYSSLRVFGSVHNGLLTSALELLERIPPRSRERTQDRYVNAEEFARHVATEIKRYRKQYADFTATGEIREDVTGLLTSRGKLLIGKRLKIARSRMDALIQHEVGTHLVTYYNGKSQPFKQLYLGLAGYDELQEGLAVLSEYLVGGLSRPRLRLLAARVVAVRWLTEGASFVDTYRELHDTYGLDMRSAFTVTMRVYRGGGLTKDATYLKGFIKLLEYLRDGGDLDCLFIGKFNLPHIPFIRELCWRKVLHATPVRPRWLNRSETADRLRHVRRGLSPIDLIESKSPRRIHK